MEPWLRDPIDGIIPELQPIAAVFIAAKEDVQRATEGLPDNVFAETPGGAASLAFHIVHLAGATDRLLTYAFGDALTDAQKAALATEKTLQDVQPGVTWMVETLCGAMDEAVERLMKISAEDLSLPRALGRSAIPTTMRALVVHAAEHASRHAGQIVTTCKIVATHS